MSYDLVGVELGRMLTQWGLDRMARRDEDARYQQRVQAEIEAEDRRARRQAPTIRTVRVAQPDGSVAEVDQQQNYDPDTRAVTFTPIGEPRPVPSEPASAYPHEVKVRDPDAPNRWVFLDRSTNEYVTDKDGRRLEASPPSSVRSGGGGRGKRPAMTDPDAARADFSNVRSGPAPAKQPEKSAPGASQDNPVAVASKAEAAKLPAGTWIKTPSGAVVQKT